MVSLPVGRTVAKPAILFPFRFPGVIKSKISSACSPTVAVQEVLTKVRGWAKVLRSGEASGLIVIANKEGISVARVSQLLVLDRLPEGLVDHWLKNMKRVSLRKLIKIARTV